MLQALIGRAIRFIQGASRHTHIVLIATHFACDHVTGLAPTTVIGKVVLLRLDGPNGQPVNLTRDEEAMEPSS
jgi:hypothetical protein